MEKSYLVSLLSVEQIDLVTAKLRTLRQHAVNLVTANRKFKEAEDGFAAAKEGAREAMENDDFDKVNAFSSAMKRQHKAMEDARDRKIELEDLMTNIGEDLIDWPLSQFEDPAATTASKQETKNEEPETTTDEETLELAA